MLESATPYGTIRIVELRTGPKFSRLARIVHIASRQGGG